MSRFLTLPIVCLLVAVLAVTMVPAQADDEAGRFVVFADTPTGHRIDPDLVGFNWRDGGEAVGPLAPTTLRMWAVNFNRITTAPGEYDWSLADDHVARIRSVGATPMIVLIGRPSWSPLAGSAGYEEAVEAAVRRYGVEQVPDGAQPAIFEAGNEPEFYPTSHGQLPWELPLDAAAQARAVARVEADSGVELTWGGPGALFADPPILEAFARAAEAAGRPADYLSFHHYSNYPMLGPDGAEHTDPASAAVTGVLAGRNPVASPRVIGESVRVAALVASAHADPATLGAPEVVVSEWNLSAGGFDERHDSHEGAAHALAGLIELHEAGAGAAQFFAATDRHCDQPDDAPDPLCGDWGTATADGVRKPVWHAFDLWNRLAGDVVLTSGGVDGDPTDAPTHAATGGTWSIATDDGEHVRLLVTSFSVSEPRSSRFAVSVVGAAADTMLVWTIDDSTPDTGPEPVVVGAHDVVELPANSAVLVEVPLRSD